MIFHQNFCLVRDGGISLVYGPPPFYQLYIRRRNLYFFRRLFVWLAVDVNITENVSKNFVLKNEIIYRGVFYITIRLCVSWEGEVGAY